MSDPSMIVAADVGNSGIRLATSVSSADLMIPRRYSIQWPDSDSMRSVNLAEKCRWYACSVHSGRIDSLRHWIHQHRPNDRIHMIDHRQVPIGLNVESPARTGIDRLVAAWNAWTLCGSDKAVIVVDAGTAVTVDLISANGLFEGGNIFPGATVALRSLGASTDLLPEVEENHCPLLPLGNSTKSAILSGVYRSLAGGIRYIVDRLAEHVGGDSVPVVMTGGGIPSIRHFLCDSWRHEPHLVLDGVLKIALLSQDD